jgi:hypothetical protein
LRRGIATGESFSRLNILSKTPPLSLFDMLFITRGGLRTWFSLCGLPYLVVLFCCWTLVLPLCSLFSPLLLGALVYLWLARFHHKKPINFTKSIMLTRWAFHKSYTFQKATWVFSHDTQLVPIGYHRKFWGKKIHMIFMLCLNPGWGLYKIQDSPSSPPHQGPLFL